MSNGKNIGYIRVSSADQNTDRQLKGVDLDKIYIEKLSGKDIKRPELQKCLDYLREGDTLHIHSMDRLSRKLTDLIKIVEVLTDIGITVNFHKESLLFNGQSDHISKLMLHLIGAIAQFERSNIKDRQKEGIEAAKKRGKYLGRLPSLTKKQKTQLVQLDEEGASKQELASIFGVSRATVYNVLKEFKKD